MNTAHERRAARRLASQNAGLASGCGFASDERDSLVSLEGGVDRRSAAGGGGGGTLVLRIAAAGGGGGTLVARFGAVLSA